MNTKALVGRWKLISWTNLSDGRLFFPFGKKPSGWAEFTENEFSCFAQRDFTTNGNDADLSTPFFNKNISEMSAAGSYKLTKDLIDFKYIESSMEVLVNQSFSRDVYFDGHQTLIISGKKALGEGEFTASATYIKV